MGLPVVINAWQNEEETGTGGAALFEPAEPKDDGSLVLLDHFDAVAQREGQCDENEQQGDGRQEQRAHPRDVLRALVRQRRHRRGVLSFHHWKLYPKSGMSV